MSKLIFRTEMAPRPASNRADYFVVQCCLSHFGAVAGQYWSPSHSTQISSLQAGCAAGQLASLTH
jgi:hypothetical protein